MQSLKSSTSHRNFAGLSLALFSLLFSAMAFPASRHHLHGTIALSASTYAVAQAAGTVTITVARSAGTSGAVTVNYSTANGSAAAGTNYTAASGTLAWAAGDAANKTFAVPINTTSPFTGIKTFSIALSSPSGRATLGSPSTAQVSITASAVASSGTLSLGAASYSVAAANGALPISVNRTGGSGGAVTVAYATTNGTAVAGLDYTAATGTLSWASGDSAAKTVNVPISTTVSQSKSFNLAIASATGGAQLGAPASAAITIVPTAAANHGALGLTGAAYGVNQATGTAQITVARSGGSSGAVSVAYATANGTAIAGTNYTAASGTLAWAAGDAANKTFAVPISTAPFSGTKAFTVTLSAAAGGATVGPTSTATVTIAGAGTVSPSSAQIVINAMSDVAPITANQLGTNMGAWFDETQGGDTAAITATGAHLVRWPGGSNSDAYNWQNQNGFCNGMYMNPASTFDNFMNDVAIPGGFEVAITVNYGSNPPACNAGGDPKLAAAWVAYSKSKGYNVHHWTVGNEVFGGWEYDLHSVPNDPTTYANAMSGANGYYQLMKNADSTAQIGVVVNGVPADNPAWDPTVLSKAPYDFVELHWYAQQPGQESDSYLLKQAPSDLRTGIAALRAELQAAGKSASTPILLGEFNSVAYNQGKQTMSIVNALFAGMVFGEILNNNVQMATWWFGYGGGCNGGGNNSSSLYGWQDFGGYDQVSSDWMDCSPSGGLNWPEIPAGVVLPTGYAEKLVSQFAVPGGTMLTTTVATSLPNVRAYGATNGTGYSVMIFNLDQNAATSATVGVSNTNSTSFNATTMTYGKAQYDNSKNNVWTAPVSQSLGAVNGAVTLSLPPWSMTVLKLN
jgi:hypothetical protein